MPSLPPITMPAPGTVRIGLPDGVGLQFPIDDPPRLRDLVDEDHPSFLSLLAAMRWLRQRGVTWRDLRQNATLRADYAAATWTLTVSP